MKMVNEEIRPRIYIISDSIGETAEFVVKAALAQYDIDNALFRRFPYVNDENRIKQIVDEAAELKENCIIVYTLVKADTREALEQEAMKFGVRTVDLMGPVMEALSGILPVNPRNEPGLVRKLDQRYFQRITAVEFAVKYDDGKDPRGFLLADVVLVGVSRTSKTPLSMYLAYRGLKVANLPLVPEIKPPGEIYDLPPSKVFGVSIDPELLQQIRRERISNLGFNADTGYASLNRILEEQEYAERIMRRLGCRVFDVSSKAVEEIARIILNTVKGDG